MTKKLNVVKMIVCMAVPLIVGIVSSLLTGNAMSQFGALNQPPLSPPAILFPIAWTILYLLMGLASYYILEAEADTPELKSIKRQTFLYYALQLAFNFAWCILFFKLGAYFVAFIWLIIMWVLILLTMIKAFKISKLATILLIPYIIWCTFAGYLNIMIAILN